MESLTLNELYRVATGNTQVDIDEVVNNIKSKTSESEKNTLIGSILYTIPGGVGMNKMAELFKKKFYEKLGGVSADVDKDDDVDQDDYEAVKAGKDITGDGKVDEDDLNLVKALSTAEIEEFGDDEPIEDVETPKVDEPIKGNEPEEPEVYE